LGSVNVTEIGHESDHTFNFCLTGRIFWSYFRLVGPVSNFETIGPGFVVWKCFCQHYCTNNGAKTLWNLK